MAEVAAEFADTLSDLTVNSKPHINMLTMLAEDNHEYAPHITQTVLSHLQKVPPEMKLPVLYLIDSIIKNVGKSYIPLFTQAIVQQFANTFEQVDEKTREQMFKLRQTWGDMFPAKVLFALDSKVKKIDSAWPCTASPPSTVHFNPKFFKADIIGSKSLATVKDTDSHRSGNRKSRTTSRSQSHSSSSRSKKTSQASSAVPEGVTKTPGESLREQVIMKQKMLLELQQQKLKLELLQTQAQLEEQQKQLERQSLNQKPSSEPSTKALKLQQMVNEEEAKYKIMSKNLKRHMQMKFPKLHQVHRMTTEMKAQAQKADLTKASAVPEGLLKPAALLELNQGDVHVKPLKSVAAAKPVPSPALAPKEAKPRIVLQPPMEKQKAAVPVESTEEAPPPVRIAPVSSQLINAALSFGRNVRDPRIRQMSSRLETQLNSGASAPVHHTHPPAPAPTFTPPSAPAAVVPPPPVVRKPETGQDSRFNSKPKRDKRSNNSHKESNSSHHKEKLSRSSEEDSKHSKSPIRSSEKTSRRVSGKGEKPLSKKVEDKKSKVEDLFSSRSKSPIHLKPASSSQSPSKSHSKRDHISLPSNAVGIPSKTNLIGQTYEEEPCLKKARLHDNQQQSQSPVEGISELKDSAVPVRQVPKLSLDVKAAESTKPDSNRSPESLDSSADMLDEDIEKIVKHTVKRNKFAQKVSFQVESPQKSPKSSDNSPEDRFEDIIRNPTKQIKKHEISKSGIEMSKPLEVQIHNIRHQVEIKTTNKSDNSNVLAQSKGTENVFNITVVDIKKKDLQSSDIYSTKKILNTQRNEAQESVQTKNSVQQKVGQSQIGRTSSTFTQYKEALELLKTKQSVPQTVEQSPVQIGRTSGTFTQHKETQESVEVRQSVPQIIEQGPLQIGRTPGTFTQHKEPQESVKTKLSVTQIIEPSAIQTKQSVPQIVEQSPVQFGHTSGTFTKHKEPQESAQTKQSMPQIVEQSPVQFGDISGSYTQHKEGQESVQTKQLESKIIEESPTQTGHILGTFTIKDPRLHSQIQESKTVPDPYLKLSVQEESKNIEEIHEVDNEALYNVTQPEEFSSTINPMFDNHNDINERFITEEVVTTEIMESKPEDSETLQLDHEHNSSEKPPEIQNLIPVPPEPLASNQQSDYESKEESLFSLKCSENSKELTLSPKNVPSPVENLVSMEVSKETDENIISAMEISSPTRAEKRRSSPVHERKSRKGEKQSIMEHLIADAEKHEASPSPPPPPIISDKFKEIKQSSLSRLRRVGRLRDDLGDSESPEPADVDLRPQIQPPLIKDLKNEVLGLADKDVDLRNLSASPTKKRPSMEKLADVPPAKKSKAEVLDELPREMSLASVKIRYFPARPDSAHWYNNSRICVYKRLFGSEDVDLRPVLCPPPPSPPPPPIISSSPPGENAGEKGWAHYKENKPDTYKAKYTPSRRDRDRAPSIDRFSSRHSRNSTDGGWQGRTRTSSYQKDVDMRAHPLGVTDGSYNQIIMQAYEQLKRGDLNNEAYQRVLREVCAMREKQQLEEAQRRDEEAAQAEPLEPISDDEISGGSLSGVEDAPSPTDSYTGGEDVEESSLPKPKADNFVESNQEKDHAVETHKHGDIDIRLPPTDMDIRMGIPPLMEMDDNQLPVLLPVLEDKSRRKNIDGSHYNRHSYREEMRAQKREKRARRSEERGLPYRSSRYAEDSWDSQERRSSPSEARIDAEPPRVPPIPNYREHLLPPRDSPPLHPPGPWETQRMTAPPPAPWLPGMAPPVIRGPPPVMSMPPPVQQERFMPPRWRQPRPGPIFEGEPPAPRFRFGPLLGRPPVPFALEVPPTDPNVLKLIEEDPTKTISIDGVPRDIRFYGPKAVALMNWDDPREVTFQNGSRRIIVDDRDSLVIHFNSPPLDMIIDGKTHRVRFGAPTRELYVDNQWYEVFFGGSPVTCEIGGKPHKVQLEGPPPNVRPGIQRKDLVVGKISLIIDAEYVFCIYLDAKPQKFEVDGVAYIIRFVEALQKTVINGVPFQSDFGGLPQPIILNGTKHFFRLTALPRGVTPGFITIVNMEGGRMPSPPSLPAPPQLPASLEQVVEFSAEPTIGDTFLPLPPIPHITQPPRLSPEVLNREVEAVPPTLPPTNVPPPMTSLSATVLLPPPVPSLNTLDMLTTLMPTPEPGRAVEYSYSVDNENSNHTAALTTTSVSSTTTTAPTLSGDINVTELLQKLMATGIVPKLEQPKDKDQDKPVVADSGLIRPVDFLKPETLKIRQTSLVAHLYSGIQCNSCGVRFPPEQTMKYSQHLDWHFRQNRRDKDSTRTAQTRRYYYDVNDWVQFEEIEDLEERAQPWFDMQESDQAGAEEAAPAVLVSVRAADYPEDAACNICQDKFESFYNEEKEEWQLRNAVDTDGNLAHPLCIEDQRAAAEKPIVLDDIDITEDELKEEEVKEKKEEGGEQKAEEDDDIMEVTDIEFVKPVFPVEDLTVSDSESVADNNEDKPEILEEDMKEDTEKAIPNVDTEETENQVETDETKEEEKDEEAKNEEDTVQEEGEKAIEDLSKDENTQDDLLVVDKGEDSVLSTAEILEVVRNIKKDPDALGGEYEEEVQDPDLKKEKSEVPLPAPVVDTTHTTVTCLIDGNVEFEETPQQLNVGGPQRIKINITKPNVQPASREPKESILGGSIPEYAILAEKLNFVNQPPPPGEEVSHQPPPPGEEVSRQPPPPGEEFIPVFVKEKLIGRDLQDMPLVKKGSELSGLCSIM